jgi:hypothetical protein
MEQEGADEARWLAAHGVAAFVLELDQPPAMGELTVFPTLLANWLQLRGWMAPQPQ